ncbi:MAG: acetyl-CoA carboxylase biotin carboxyl carrier protein subunit [Clostridia bacterium]|nr:acetyl-CoA carboxylase biotin carboxyl carrier protein subunit [Clostridia bacterium]
MRKFNVVVNGNSYSVEVEEVGGASAPVSAPAPVSVPAPAAAPKAAPAGGTPVTAPMPGVVRKLSLSDGASVQANQTVMVVEAMKMENDIVSSAAGTITYNVKVGDKVETGTVLAYIK